MLSGQTPWQALDLLSPAGRAVATLNAGAAYTRLVVRGERSSQARAMLAKLRPEEVLCGPTRSPDDGRAALAGLWLWHDWLDESHAISQSLHTATGSFWHAIMHRREGDFSNSKYWYARCRHHPALDEIARQAKSAGKEWTGSNAFVDVVKAVHRSPDDPLYRSALRLQQLEWQTLFAHCARSAVGGG